MEITSVKSGGIFKTLSHGFFYIFIILILLNIVYSSIQEKTPVPAIKELGKEFLFSTKQLSDSSKEIVENKGLWIASGSFLSSLWNLFNNLSLFFIAFYTIYLWLKILSKIVGWSFMSNNSNTFLNVSFALLIFILFQAILLISTASINKEIDCFSSCDKSVINTIKIPVVWVYDFYKAVPYFIKPASGIKDRVIGNTPDISNMRDAIPLKNINTSININVNK